MVNLIILALSVIAAASIGFALGKITAGIRGIEKRLDQLESDKTRHLPYGTTNELEDATAAILRIGFEADWRKDLVENALAHLQAARAGKK